MEVIHIQIARVELGPYSERQVRQFLAEGLLLLSDPARYIGQQKWIALSDVLKALPSPMVIPASTDKAPAVLRQSVDPVARESSILERTSTDATEKLVVPQASAAQMAPKKSYPSWVRGYTPTVLRLATPPQGEAIGPSASVSGKTPSADRAELVAQVLPVDVQVPEKPLWLWIPPVVPFLAFAEPSVPVAPVMASPEAIDSAVKAELATQVSPVTAPAREKPLWLWIPPVAIQIQHVEPKPLHVGQPPPPSSMPEPRATSANADPDARVIPVGQSTSEKEPGVSSVRARSGLPRGQVSSVPVRIYISPHNVARPAGGSVWPKVLLRHWLDWGIYAFTIVVLALALCTWLNWAWIGPGLSSFWFDLNLILYRLTDDLLSIFTGDH